MKTLRLILLALGCLFTIAACWMVVGVTWMIFEEGETPTGDAWLGIVSIESLLVLLAVGLFYLVRLIGRKQTTLDLAAQVSYVPIEFSCPKCDSARIVQGPEERSWLLHTYFSARCLACGHRLNVSSQMWRWLPLGESGDAYATWRDKQHLMRRAPMTAGQTAFVLFGLIGFFVVLILLVGVDDIDGAFETYDGLLLTLLLPVLYGFWWLGGQLFPFERIGDEHCAQCGYDIRGCAEACCPRCGTPFHNS